MESTRSASRGAHKCFSGSSGSRMPSSWWALGLVSKHSIAKHEVYHAGYDNKIKHSTKACGVAIALVDRTFRGAVHSVRPPPAALRGRALGLRVVTRRHDFLLLAGYFPPKGSLDHKEYTKLVDRLVGWINTQSRARRRGPRPSSMWT